MTEESKSEDAFIFVNYRRTDSGWCATLLENELRETFGQDRVFLDVRGIDAGDDFIEELQVKLHRATAVIVLIGKNWLQVHDKFGRRRLDDPHDWVREEIRNALQNPGCRVVPVLIDDAQLPDERGALPEDISELLKRQWMRLRQTNSVDDIEALSRELARAGFRRLVGRPGNVVSTRQPMLPLCRYCQIGPLTLGATLRSPIGQGMLEAYPTGSAGAHFVFDLHNPNPVDFSVVAVEVEVLAYQAIELEDLLHGVGATDITRRFKVKVQSAPGRYRATYTGGAHPAEYVKILAGKDDRFDVEITTATEGLYQLRVHVLGTMEGTRFDAPIDATKTLIVFFDKENRLVDRGQMHVTYAEYIKEMATYDANGYLSEYSMFDDTICRP